MIRPRPLRLIAPPGAPQLPSLCLLLLVLLVAPSVLADGPVTDDTEAFDLQHPNPNLGPDSPSGVDGRSVISVIAPSAGVSDRRPDLWLMTRSGRKYELNPSGLGRALLELGHVAQTPEQALAIARVLPDHDRSETVVTPDSIPARVDLPPQAMELIQAPEVIRKDDHFEVTLDVFYNYLERGSTRDSRVLSRQQVRIGPDRIQQRSQVLWKARGTLVIYSRPGATYEVDGTIRGTAPVQLGIEPGDHVIVTVGRHKMWRKRRKVHVGMGETVEVHFER